MMNNKKANGRFNVTGRPRRRKTTAVIFLAVLCQLASGANAFLCEKLEEDNWESLVAAMEASEFLMLCPPLEIKGDGCPRSPVGHIIPVNASRTILCERGAFGGSLPTIPSTAAIAKEGESEQQAQALSKTGANKCILDCPGTHFTIEANATLTIDGMTLRGSRKSSIQIEPHGQLQIFETQFEDNNFAFGNGGAIQSGENARLVVNQCEFTNNTALNGGAIFAEGESYISFSKFVNNKALAETDLSGGGAIGVGVYSKTTITACEFDGNAAASDKGNAVLDHSEGAKTQSQANKGCNNNLKGADVCNGIERPNPEPTEEPCQEFEVTCAVAAHESKEVWPTIAPSPMPSTLMPTIDPCREHKDSFECILHELLEELP